VVKWTVAAAGIGVSETATELLYTPGAGLKTGTSGVTTYVPVVTVLEPLALTAMALSLVVPAGNTTAAAYWVETVEGVVPSVV